MQHSQRHFELRLSQSWLGMQSVRPELCDYSFEQPKTALCEGTVA